MVAPAVLVAQALLAAGRPERAGLELLMERLAL
jgi:hypothetical protein